MAGGISISLVSDVSSVIKGAGDVERALDQVAGSLDDLAREAQGIGQETGRGLSEGVEGGAREARSATERLERSFKDMADAGRREAKSGGADMERSFKDMADTAKREAKTAGDALGDSTRDGMRRGGDYVGEFKDEAKSNLAEVASSFSGGIDSAADLVQGTLGGLTAVGGPVGLLAAALAAIGGGMYASFSREAEATEARIQSMYDDMVESGNEYLSEQLVQSNVHAIIGRAEDAAIKWGDLQDIVKATGATESLVARAFAGDQAALNELMDLTRDKREAITDTTLAGAGEETAALAGPQRELLGIQARLEDVQDANDEAAARTKLYAQTVAEASGQTQAELAAIKGGYDNIPSEKRTNIVISDNVDEVQRRVNSIRASPITLTAILDTSGAQEALARWRPTVPVGVRVGGPMP